MLSISSGLKSAIPSLLTRPSPMIPLSRPPLKLKIGIPSITYSTLLSPSIDLAPRMITRVAPPTPLALLEMLTPATFPFNEFTKLASLLRVNSFEPTDCTL